MASQSTPGYFKPYQSTAYAAAAAAGLSTPYFSSSERGDKDLVKTIRWRATNLPVDMPDVAGAWTFYLSYDFQSLPGSQNVEMIASSFGLGVGGCKLADGAAVTVVRFDYDASIDEWDGDGAGSAGPPVAVHLNVLQEAPLGSHLHLPAFRTDPWEPGEVLSWLTSKRLRQDLKRHMPL